MAGQTQNQKSTGQYTAASPTLSLSPNPGAQKEKPSVLTGIDSPKHPIGKCLCKGSPWSALSTSAPVERAPRSIQLHRQRERTGLEPVCLQPG